MLPSAEKTTTIKGQLQKETQYWNNRPRYGLFSYTSSHGFGFRDGQNMPSHRDERGRVQTAPRNFFAGRPQTSLPGLDVFTKTGYLSHNDEYVDPKRVMRYRDDDPNKIKRVHSVAFKPSGNNPKPLKAPYEYVAEQVESTKTINVAPRNFVGSQPKKGYGNSTVGHLFSGIKYETDPYEYQNIVDSMERQEHANKIKSGPFHTTFSHRDHFTPNIKLYQEPPGMQEKKRRQMKSVGALKPFLPSDPLRTGYNCTIGRFPEYVGEPPSMTPPLVSPKHEGIWRDPYKELTTPAPSVQTYNALNRPSRKF